MLEIQMCIICSLGEWPAFIFKKFNSDFLKFSKHNLSILDKTLFNTGITKVKAWWTNKFTGLGAAAIEGEVCYFTSSGRRCV